MSTKLSKPLEAMDYHPTSERLVNVLCQKTQSDNKLFFRILVAYYFTKVASMMRCNVDTKDRGLIPVNMYAVNLALSGQGKGHSTNIIEDSVIHQFKHRFLNSTFEIQAAKNIKDLAQLRAAKSGKTFEEEETALEREFINAGPLAFSFDSGTAPAVKQMRHKLLMACAGSMNLEMDEIGSNLMGNTEVLNTFLELFDVGKIKQKLIKNTNENARIEDIDGRTPTNMMLFGTPAKLLNGSKTEEEFVSMLETGFARRCFFGYSKTPSRDNGLTAQEIYDLKTDNTTNSFLNSLANDLSDLADVVNFNKSLEMDKANTLELINYEILCNRLAEKMPDHKEIEQAEMKHRYFKAMKLAGTYAFIDGSKTITRDHLHYAIKLVEESGKAFKNLMNRDRNWVRLAHYIASAGVELTEPDLVEDLPFFKGSLTEKNNMINMAIAYGYKNNIVIKRFIDNDINFFSGETLEETDLNRMKVSYSQDLAQGYIGQYVPFNSLHKLTQTKGYHWASHHFKNDYRNEESALSGFNMVVLDIDGGTPIKTAQVLLKEYKYLMYTTKRHTDAQNRYRIILPLSHTLYFNTKEYKEFMQNVGEWLPFEVDEQTFQRSRKWESFAGKHFYNDGDLLDALLFIPKTKNNDIVKKTIKDLAALNNVERWFMKNIDSGNRNNQLLKYALMLVDAGMDVEEVNNKVLTLNNKLSDRLEEAEIMTTIMRTVSQRIHERDIKQQS